MGSRGSSGHSGFSDPAWDAALKQAQRGEGEVRLGGDGFVTIYHRTPSAEGAKSIVASHFHTGLGGVHFSLNKSKDFKKYGSHIVSARVPRSSLVVPRTPVAKGHVRIYSGNLHPHKSSFKYEGKG